MSIYRLLVALYFVVSGVATGASAQFTTQRQPAELPPEGYTASQYVDSEGCVFVRAGIGGVVSWVPRVNRAREAMCGFEPSLTTDERTALSPEIPDDLIIEIPQLTQVVSLGTEAASDVAQVPAVEVPKQDASKAAISSLRLSDVCNGKTGIQQGYRVEETGEPVDCGTVEEKPVAAGTAPSAPLQMRQPEAAPATTAMPETALERGNMLTLAQICADTNATGRNYILKSGVALDCGNVGPNRRFRVVSIGAQTPVEEEISPVAPARLSAPAAAEAVPVAVAGVGACRYEIGTIDEYFRGGNRVPYRCVPQAERPYASQPSQHGERAVAHMPLSSGNSTTTSQPQSAAVPEGYEPVWNDGRLNTQRGIPTGSTAQNVQSGDRVKYIQVGVFGVAANAERTEAMLQDLGLSTERGQMERNGLSLAVIAAGPVALSDVSSALSRIRAAGFRDAFVR